MKKRRKILTGFKSYKEAAKALNVTEKEARKIALELYRANSRIRSLQQKEKDVIKPKVQTLKTLSQFNGNRKFNKIISDLKEIQKAEIVEFNGVRFLNTNKIEKIKNKIPKNLSPSEKKKWVKDIQEELKKLDERELLWVNNVKKAYAEAGFSDVYNYLNSLPDSQVLKWLYENHPEGTIYLIYKAVPSEREILKNIRDQIR